jgi:hypothetical protein
MQVRIYRNLTRSCLSIQAKTAKGWRVIAHASAAELEGVSFEVNERVRQRVLATGHKEVHAYAVGTLVGWTGSLVVSHEAPEAAILAIRAAPPVPEWAFPVSYNPRRQGAFHRVTGRPYGDPSLRGCAWLCMSPVKMGAVGLRYVDPAGNG